MYFVRQRGDNAKERSKSEPQEQKSYRNIIGKKTGDRTDTECERGNDIGRVKCACLFYHIPMCLFVRITRL